MSRVSIKERLYRKPEKSALEFDWDALWAPPIRSILTQWDINELIRIATSLKLNGKVEKKYQLIDAVMNARGFKREHCGTNRIVYRFLEMPSFVAKVAIDKVGMRDSPAEFKNQKWFKPFCCKIFEVDPSGVIAFVERVNPITSLQEFMSVSDDIFNMMLTKIIGKYVVDDLGTTKFMNYGLRQNANGCSFGPVIIDFPYAYELDGAKLICNRTIETPNGPTICGGEIDYDAGFNNLICPKCGHRYTARELSKDESNVIKTYSSDEDDDGPRYHFRAIITDKEGKVIMDTGRKSKYYMTAEELMQINSIDNGERETEVERTITKNNKGKHDYRRDEYEKQRMKIIEGMHEAADAQKPFNPVIEIPVEEPTVVAKSYYQNPIIGYPNYGETNIDEHSYRECSEVIETYDKTTGKVITSSNLNNEELESNAMTDEDIKSIIPELNNGVIPKQEEKPAEETVTVDEEENFDAIVAQAIIEAAHTPMINLSGENYEEEDYSNYIPEEESNKENEEEEDDPYSEYEDNYEDGYDNRGRQKKRAKKKFDDMSDY